MLQLSTLVGEAGPAVVWTLAGATLLFGLLGWAAIVVTDADGDDDHD